jgi:hypothetical protein
MSLKITENSNPTDFDDTNETILDTSDFGQKSHIIDTQTHITSKIVVVFL